MGEDDLRDGVAGIVERLCCLIVQCQSIQHMHCAIGEPNHCNSHTQNHIKVVPLVKMRCCYFIFSSDGNASVFLQM